MDPSKIVSLFLLIMIGYIAKKLNVVKSDIKGHLSTLVLNITLPLYIFTAMQFEFSTDVLQETGMLVIISFIYYAVVYLLANGFTKLTGQKDTRRDIFQYMITFSNVGYMGYPVMYELAGEKGMFYAAIYNLSFNILTWTLGVYIMSRHKSQEENQSIKERLVHVLNPSLFAVILGFMCFLFSIKVPSVLIDTFKNVGSATTPLSMMFIGIILAEIKLQSIFTDVWVFIVSGIRLLVLPIMTFYVLRFLGFDGLLLTIPVVLSAMPASANSAIIASRYGNDSQLASKMIFVSTLFCIISVPFILRLLT
ncbi:AEC family transporter [Acidaminobacter sp. JC074]|uniref:AEC family transporter n=1 Tax=Acidaminobacter sp. JC074 TaxID=2530199 RepID=UPI001F0F639B|nr:AEC family transporter [Acidaminobacter sp. JC074]MCH4889317.1 AEC family transporter [Acidaminobacter sp. JC074]